MAKYIACIGSRDVPTGMRQLMRRMGRALVKRGWIVRSGNANGSDRSFVEGANDVDPTKVELYQPWPEHYRVFIKPGNVVLDQPTPDHYLASAPFHPVWNSLKDEFKALHARNAGIILGQDCKTPVDRVLCFTKNASGEGGTGQGIRIANGHRIPVYDIGSEVVMRKVCAGLQVRPPTMVVNLYHLQGDWKNDPLYVYVGRAGKGMKDEWGNPHHVDVPCPAPTCFGRYHKRGEALKLFYEENLGDIAYLTRVPELAGKKLVCFCVPKPWMAWDTPMDQFICHGQLLAVSADMTGH